MVIEHLQAQSKGYVLRLLKDYVRRASSPSFSSLVAAETLPSIMRWMADVLLLPNWINFTVDRGGDGYGLDVIALKGFISPFVESMSANNPTWDVWLNVAADQGELTQLSPETLPDVRNN